MLSKLIIFGLALTAKLSSGMYAEHILRGPQEITLQEDGKDGIRVAFGSCYGVFSHESDIFTTIAEDEPDLFVWLGDVAYVDAPDIFFRGMPPEYVVERFKRTKEAPGYDALTKKSKIIGVWDDHDYGSNDAGRRFKLKDQNRDLFLDFIGEPSDTERRTQKGTPIY